MIKIYKEGYIYYNDNKQLHNLYGPAVYFNDGWFEYWVNGTPHRLDGPAMSMRGATYWIVNGKYHRIDGPAVEYVSGYKAYWKGGMRHRLDGPAIVRADGTQEWWFNGNFKKCNSQEEFVKLIKNSIINDNYL